MPKASIEEQEVPVAPDPEPTAPEPAKPLEEVPEEPAAEEVPVPKAKTRVRKDAPATTKRKTDLKEKHTCGACGKTVSLHTALYGHKNCPGKVSMPQPPALTTRPVEEAPEEPPQPQLTQAQFLRLQLAQAAQERRAQQHMRMVAPIRRFYGL